MKTHLSTILFPFAVAAIAMGDDFIVPPVQEPTLPLLETARRSQEMQRWLELRDSVMHVHLDGKTGAEIAAEMERLELFIRCMGNEQDIRLLNELTGKQDFTQEPVRSWGEAMRRAYAQGKSARAYFIGEHGGERDRLYATEAEHAQGRYILLPCYQDGNGQWDEAGQSVIKALNLAESKLGDAAADGGCMVTQTFPPASQARPRRDAYFVYPSIAPQYDSFPPYIGPDCGTIDYSRKVVIDLRRAEGMPFPILEPALGTPLSAEGEKLRESILKGDVDTISQLVAEAPHLLRERGWATAGEPESCSPLEFSVKYGSAATTRALLQAGASPNERGADGRPVLVHSLCREYADLEQTRLLLEAGARPNAFFPSPVGDITESPLMYAAGNKQAVLLLLHHGATVHVLDEEALRTRLPEADWQEIREVIHGQYQK